MVCSELYFTLYIAALQFTSAHCVYYLNRPEMMHLVESHSTEPALSLFSNLRLINSVSNDSKGFRGHQRRERLPHMCTFKFDDEDTDVEEETQGETPQPCCSGL